MVYGYRRRLLVSSDDLGVLSCVMGKAGQLEAGSASSANHSTLAVPARAVQPARDELEERDSRLEKTVDDHETAIRRSRRRSLTRVLCAGPNGKVGRLPGGPCASVWGTCWFEGQVCGLVARPPEAIGATSEELLVTCELGKPLFAYCGELPDVDQRV